MTTKKDLPPYSKSSFFVQFLNFKSSPDKQFTFYFNHLSMIFSIKYTTTGAMIRVRSWSIDYNPFFLEG